ncbi:hypothetical protein G7Y89_g14512 [Cudoniella acicularis]|uniref:RRM domain-containing protein n=1 Tax=Cudoniella acicularis TaxID=354080 RepID=A0A8H4R3K1_9HELO|nr:hypothetical protein G7Y89_g14512 [Cudoniella acicularis]
MDTNNWRAKAETVSDDDGTSPNWRMKRETVSEEDTSKNRDIPRRVIQTFRPGSEGFQKHEPSEWGSRSSSRDGQSPHPGGRTSTGDNKNNKQSRVKQPPPEDQLIHGGCQLWVGNLPNEAGMGDIRKFFESISNQIKEISILVDETTGRNPNYCYVGMVSRHAADNAIEAYDGEKFKGRNVKVEYAVIRNARGKSQLKFNIESKEYSPPRPQVYETPKILNRKQCSDTLNPLIDLDELNTATKEERHLCIGGLPKFLDQPSTTAAIRLLFKNYDVAFVSRLVSPYASVQDEKSDIGNHYYCFVSLRTKEEVDRAIKELGRRLQWGRPITVQRATGAFGKPPEKQNLVVGGLPFGGNPQGFAEAIKDLLSPFGGFSIVSGMYKDQPLDGGISPRETMHCHVLFDDPAQNDVAIAALHRIEKWDCQIRVELVGARKRTAVGTTFVF